MGFWTQKTNKNQQKPENLETWRPRSHFPETSHVCMFKKPKKPTETTETYLNLNLLPSVAKNNDFIYCVYWTQAQKWLNVK